MPRKKPTTGKPKVNEELEGLEININEFGEINTNYDLDKIIQFLNREIDDKKLRNREDVDQEGKFMNFDKRELLEKLEAKKARKEARKKGAGKKGNSNDEEE